MQATGVGVGGAGAAASGMPFDGAAAEVALAGRLGVEAGAEDEVEIGGADSGESASGAETARTTRKALFTFTGSA